MVKRQGFCTYLNPELQLRSLAQSGSDRVQCHFKLAHQYHTFKAIPLDLLEAF